MLERWVVENDRGCAGLFRVRNLRVIGGVAALQKGDISTFEIGKLFGEPPVPDPLTGRTCAVMSAPTG